MKLLSLTTMAKSGMHIQSLNRHHTSAKLDEAYPL